MKLYTEEQVIEMIFDAHNGTVGYDNIFKKQTPIELPSDEEIEEEAEFLFPTVNIMASKTYIAHKSFIEGVKWMREQILKNK